MRFTKMHGAGNDYVYVDCFHQAVPGDPSQLAREMSHRRFGVGSDGLILIHPSAVADARMQMFNADGSQGEMCGNGIRCVAKYVYDHGISRQNPLRIETLAGVLTLHLQLRAGRVDQVRVDLGEPILDARRIPTTWSGPHVVDQPLEVAGRTVRVTCVSLGNPHCVVFVDEASDEWVRGVGPLLETHERFPERVNVEFAEVISPTAVRQRTWERGSGETWSCGTGAAAVCVAGVLTRRTERGIVSRLLGGELQLEWHATTGHILMTGPAVEVFQGRWPDTGAVS